MKLFWVSDSVNLPTGYAQVTRNILYRLKIAGIEIENMGFQFTPIGTIPSNVPVTYSVRWPLGPTGQNLWEESYGNKGSMEHHVKDVKPDILAILCDSFMIKWLLDDVCGQKKYDKIKEYCKKTLFYFPFDSKDVYDKSAEVISLFDIKVSMSKWGRIVLKEQTGIDSHYIPHGVDTNVYRPLPEYVKNAYRKQNKWENKFVIGCVAKNQTRKMLPNLIQAYKNLLESHKDMVLFMHCNPTEGWDLVDYVKRLGLEKKVVFGVKAGEFGIHEDKMNVVYNLMDVHVLPTTGEGFGLPIIESMAAGVPNIVTDYTTAREIIGNNGEYIKLCNEMPYVIGQLNTHRALPSVPDIEKKILKLYNNESLRKKYSKRGREQIIENYNWEKIIRAWLELFEYGEIKEHFA